MQYALQFFIFNFQFQKTLLNYRGQSLLTVDCCPLTFFWAFQLSPSGFPLYLFPLRSKRMPLQSLTHWRLLKKSESFN